VHQNNYYLAPDHNSWQNCPHNGPKLTNITVVITRKNVEQFLQFFSLAHTEVNLPVIMIIEDTSTSQSLTTLSCEMSMSE